jgi:hypothetical protein
VQECGDKLEKSGSSFGGFFSGDPTDTYNTVPLQKKKTNQDQVQFAPPFLVQHTDAALRSNHLYAAWRQAETVKSEHKVRFKPDRSLHPFRSKHVPNKLIA